MVRSSGIRLFKEIWYQIAQSDLGLCCSRADSEGVRGVQSNPLTTLFSKFHFLGKFWINLVYRIYSKYSDPLLFTLYMHISSVSAFYYLWMIVKLKIAGLVANSVDPDQTPRSGQIHRVGTVILSYQTPHYPGSTPVPIRKTTFLIPQMTIFLMP